MACGKPVVSTPMEGLEKEEIGRWIRFEAPKDFILAVKESLTHKSSDLDKPPMCMKEMQAFSWTSQFNKLKTHLNEFFHDE
jgi:hypothetical protein